MTTSATRTIGDTVARHRIRVRGVVQGVGFRPFVYRLAGELGLVGLVGNDSEGVFVEAQGAASAVEAFEHRLRLDAPPLARVTAVESMEIAAAARWRSGSWRAGRELVPARSWPPMLPCAMTACGSCSTRPIVGTGTRSSPVRTAGRASTITLRLPYDRPNTTMAPFDLCAECAAEYHDAADRRFHAQPLACERCGPGLSFDGPGGCIDGTDAAIVATQRALAGGLIVSIKGLGGYHLAVLRDCRSGDRAPPAAQAPDAQAVSAVMAADLEAAPSACAHRRRRGRTPRIGPTPDCSPARTVGESNLDTGGARETRGSA